MNIVSSRYARAALDSLWADSPELAESGLAQLRAFAQVLKTEPTARQILVNPAVPAQGREDFIEKLSTALGLDVRLRRLIGLLVDRRRLDILGEVIGAYQSSLDDRKGIVRAEVTSAIALDEPEKQVIASRLEQSFGKQAVTDFQLDPELLGGLVVRVGGTVYDGSIRQHLASFRSRLIANTGKVS